MDEKERIIISLRETG